MVQYLSQALPFFDAEVSPILQVVGMANVAQTEGVVLYTESKRNGKWHVHHFAVEKGAQQALFQFYSQNLFAVVKEAL